MSMARQFIFGNSNGITLHAPNSVAFNGDMDSVPVTSCKLFEMTRISKGAVQLVSPKAWARKADYKILRLEFSQKTLVSVPYSRLW